VINQNFVRFAVALCTLESSCAMVVKPASLTLGLIGCNAIYAPHLVALGLKNRLTLFMIGKLARLPTLRPPDKSVIRLTNRVYLIPLMFPRRALSSRALAGNASR